MARLDIKNPEGIRFSSYVLQDAHLVKLGWMVPLFTVLGAVSLHLLLGNHRDIPFFISESDYPGIEGFVFTAGLFVSSVFQFLIALRLYFLFKEKARPRVLLVGTMLGVASSTHLSVLAFADMYQYLSIHVYTSIIVFHGGFAWAFLAHLSLPNPNPIGRNLRLVSLTLALVSLAVMTTTLARGIDEQSTKLGLAPDNIPLDQLQPWIDVAAPAEFILFFSLLGCLASFSWDILGHANQFEDPSIES